MNWTEHDFYRAAVRLHYWRKGHAHSRTIVLLHGITDHGPYWTRTADALAATHAVYAIDHRAHGLSDAPESGYALADFVADVVELMRVTAIAPCAVLGHSFGAALGMILAAQHPELVTGLILEDPPMWDNLLTLSAEEREQHRYDWFAWLREAQTQSRAQLLEKRRQEVPHWIEADREEWVNSKLRVRPRLWQKNGVEFGSDWRALLGQIRCPTLFVRGEPALGALVSDEHLREVDRLLQRGQSATVPNAGHSVHRDNFDGFITVVHPFLQRLG